MSSKTIRLVGKYAITYRDDGNAYSVWPHAPGAELVPTLCRRVAGLEQRLRKITEELERYDNNPAPIGDGGYSADSLVYNIRRVLEEP